MIYFILDDKTGFVKIGRSKNGGATRLAELQTGHVGKLTLVGEIDAPDELETQLHACLAAVHERGEWFRVPLPVVRAIVGLPLGAVEAQATPGQDDEAERVFVVGFHAVLRKQRTVQYVARDRCVSPRQAVDLLFTQGDTTLKAAARSLLGLSHKTLPTGAQMDALFLRLQDKDVVQTEIPYPGHKGLQKVTQIKQRSVVNGVRLWGTQRRVLSEGV